MNFIHYKPADGWLADVIPFYWDGSFRLFYLHDYRDAQKHGEGTPWRQVSTKDFVHFTEHGEMLARGNVDEQDLYVYTGSVIHAQGKFHIFYTGHNPHFPGQGKPQQAVMHAVSDDLISWKKISEDTFCAPAELKYELHDWRDPFVFFDDADQRFHMLLAARRTYGPAQRRGCTAHCVSSDLAAWQVVEPIWQPDLYYTHECPDLFRIGEWYYLLFSEFTDRCVTRYVMSRSIRGPWLAPKEDALDTRAYYAAKTASDGHGRYLFGWNPTRRDEDDNQPFSWGGSLVVHELFQKANGELGVREPLSYKNAWPAGLPVTWRALYGSLARTGEAYTLTRNDGYALMCAQQPLPFVCRVRMELNALPGTKTFGLQLRHNEQEDSSFALTFDCIAGQVSFHRMPNKPWRHMESSGLACVLTCDPHKPMHLELVLDETLVTLYINDDIAFDSRMYEGNVNGFGIFSTHGGVCAQNVLVSLAMTNT